MKDTTNSLGLLVKVSLDAGIRRPKGVGLGSNGRHMEQITRWGREGPKPDHKRREWKKQQNSERKQ